MALSYPGWHSNLVYPMFSSPETQIRLIRIQPAEDDNQMISCTSEVTTLTPNLRYAALSTVFFAHAQKAFAMLVNGQFCPVDDCLLTALWHIRKNRLLHDEETGNGESLPLWVHRVCVDSTNPSEITHQASAFGSIIEGAYKVLCWLGPQEIHGDTSTGARAIHAIRGIAQAAFGANQKILDPAHLKTFFLAHPDLSMPTDGTYLPIDWTAIFELFRLPFWIRTWTAQATVLARSADFLHFFYGDECVTWTRMSHFLAFLGWIMNINPRHSGFVLPVPLKDLIRKSDVCDRANQIQLMRNQWITSRSVAPAQIFTFSLGCISRHPSHHVFGFNAISSRKVAMEYFWDTSTAYMEFFGHVLNENDPSYLAYASGAFQGHGTRQRPLNLPSWVPDLGNYNTDAPTLLVTPYSGSGYPPFRAPREHIDYDNGILHITAARLDEGVTRKIGLYPRTITRSLPLALLCLDISTLESHPARIPPLQAFFYTLIAVLKLDQDRNAFPLRWLETTVEHFAQIAAEGFELLPHHFPLSIDPREKALEVQQQIRHVAGLIIGAQNVLMLPDGPAPTKDEVLEYMGQLGRSAVFQTRTGYIGIGPAGLSVGDEVCILNECTSTMLMRMVDFSPNLMNVGACYIHGLSSYAVKEMIRSGNIEVEELTIQ